VTLDDSVPVRRPIIAPLVILPMPGLPRYGGSMDAVLERAIADLEALEAGGVDGITLGDRTVSKNKGWGTLSWVSQGASNRALHRLRAIPCHCLSEHAASLRPLLQDRA
jgi:hypothetical protein